MCEQLCAKGELMCKQYIYVQKMWNMCKECETIMYKESKHGKAVYSVPEDVRYCTVSHLYSHIFIIDRFIFLYTGSVTSMELNH